ncbi:MAG: M4 family metallopeptidase [Bacteroidota bacterium]
MKKSISRNKILLRFFTVMIGLFTAIVAQSQTSYVQNTKIQNPDLLQIAEPSMELGLIHLKKELRINPETIFAEHKSAFGISPDCEMRLRRTSKDLVGNKHYRYQQYYKNILVESGEYIVHEKEGIAASVNGNIANELPVNATPLITEQQALTGALSFLKADEYYWQNERRENYLKTESKNSEATYFPKAELVFANINLHDNGAAKHILAYRFVISISKPYDATKAVYVDAVNGNVVKDFDWDIDCNLTTIQTNFNGSQDIFTHSNSWPDTGFDMEDDCTSTVLKVYNYNGYNIYQDGDNIWTIPAELSAGSSLWAIRKSVDTYWNEFNREGYDNDGGDINIIQGYLFAEYGPNNATFSKVGLYSAEVHVGLGNNATSVLDDFNTLDIMGHEFSHGVSNSETGWATNYSGETGALNEGFSDVMGKTIEWYVTPGDFNWVLASQRDNSTFEARRNLSNPSQFGLPDTYHGKRWEWTSDDHYGVHKNCGPFEHAFYLLSSGGSGWNSGDSAHATPGHGCYYNISGIGVPEASRIFYQALNYLGDNSGYTEACNYTIQAAMDLFPPCSNEFIQVAEAWRAVGIGSGSTCFDNSPVCDGYFIYTMSSPFYRSNSTFLAAGGTCQVEVGNSNPVSVSAHDEIQFLPGFTAATGTDFSAYVNPCVIPPPPPPLP